MKKIMIAIDAEKPDPQSLAFGRYLAALTGSELTGIFLENLPAENKPGLKFIYGGAFVESIDPADLPETEFRRKICSENIRQFKAACKEAEVPYQVHHDQGVPEQELIAESRYADVIITTPDLFASSPLELPAALVRDLLAQSECPVIIAAHHSEPIDIRPTIIRFGEILRG